MYKHIWKLTNIPFIGKADTSSIKKATSFTKGNACHC